ncbi:MULTISPECIES: LPS translocon maturation chaperone LptM [unclassified Psychrobacter]|uniref:LPS translocon maturation chaperone LptM n=1 Tax=unclassified Psychrobacter TaxID=196806 RepID=UPI003F46CF81
MFTIRRSLDTRGTQNLSANSGRYAIWTLTIGSAVMLGLSGCGQKGALYLAEPSSQTVAASDQLASTSHPQDAAFATLDDDNYDKSRYLEQQQTLPSASDDPNDY